MTGKSAMQSVAPLMKNGALTMLALDQRGSMRTIVANGGDVAAVTDARLSAFKKDAVSVLAPLASAVLLDRSLGREAMRALPKGVPLILSADDFEQAPGGPVTNSRLDAGVTPQLIEECNATALKLLVIWSEESGAEFRRDLVGRFVRLARDTGRIALVEGIVRSPSGARYATAQEHGEAVLAAAQELVEAAPDLYKAEVPGYLPGQLDHVEGFARRLTALLQQPWVVLSNGVERADFAQGVRRSCAGGASGFLAGRAIWSDAAASGDPVTMLRDRSVPRLAELIGIVRDARKVGAPALA